MTAADWQRVWGIDSQKGAKPTGCTGSRSRNAVELQNLKVRDGKLYPSIRGSPSMNADAQFVLNQDARL